MPVSILDVDEEILSLMYFVHARFMTEMNLTHTMPVSILDVDEEILSLMHFVHARFTTEMNLTHKRVACACQ
jgi:hypothetical protein